jgi:HEAT repeat protein
MLRVTSLAGVALLATAAMPGAAGRSPSQQGWSEAQPAHVVARVLLEASPGEIESGLVALGTAGLPDLFDVLASGRIPMRIGEHGNTARVLALHQESAVLGAFARLPSRRVVAFLDALAGEPLEPRAQVAALRILGRMGLREELALLTSVAAPEPGALARRAVREAFEDALVRILQRDPSAVHDVPSLYARAHLSYLEPIASALGREASPERLLGLSRLLGLVPEADRLVLIEIGRVAPGLSDADELTRANVRGHLRAGDTRVLIEAVLAIGHLGDRESVPRLIELLRHSSRTLSSGAHAALHGITGQVLGAQPESWSKWYAEEMDWWRTRASAELGLLASGPYAGTSRTILRLSKKRMFKHELAEPLAAVLRRREPDLVVLGCAALGHLGSRRAVPYLIRCLERDDEDMQSAAWRALRRITGLDLGADPAQWRGAIRG